MAQRRELALAGAAAIGVAGAAGALLQRRHLRRVASDPQREILEAPLGGRPFNARSSDGTELYGEVFGPNEGQTLVLLHGWTEALRYWTYQIRALSDQFRIVACDLRGHGRSARAATGDYSIVRFGEDLAAVLGATVPEGQRAVVAGHSLGGMSIVAWAEHHDVAARASAVALLFTGIGGLLGDQLLVQVPRFAQALSEPIARRGFLGSRAPLPRFSTPAMAAAIRYVAFGPAATPAQVAFYERMLMGCSPNVRADAGLAISEIDLYHALERLTVPTLVMAGERDRLTPPSHARRIAAELPKLHRLIEFPDTGHMGPLERGDEVSAALRALATEVSGERVTAAV